MAVNENDRVSTRRLKEFWQTAKPWIQNLVSGAIATSEETMRSTMDTKIRAAKPNYRMANTNDQIGIGYGDNTVEKYFHTYTSVNASSFPLLYFYDQIGANNDVTPLRAEYRRNIETFTAYPSIVLKNIKTAYLANMAGRIAVLPPEMSNSISTINDILDEYYNSTYDGSSLVSPIYNYNGHTYQTKVTPTTTGNYFSFSYKTDDGDFVTPSSTIDLTIAVCLTWNNPLCSPVSGHSATETIVAANLKSNAVTSTKLASDSVTSAKIANKAVTLAKIDNNIISRLDTGHAIHRHYYENNTLINEAYFVIYCTQDKAYSSSSGMITKRFSGLYLYGSVKELFGTTYRNSNVENTKIDINNTDLSFNTKNMCQSTSSEKWDGMSTPSTAQSTDTLPERFYGFIYVKENGNTHLSPIYAYQLSATTHIEILDATIIQYISPSSTTNDNEVHIFTINATNNPGTLMV